MARRNDNDLSAVAKAEKRARRLLHRAEDLRARQAAREERDAKTRRYRLGQMLESFMFEEPALLAQVKELVQRMPLEHVHVAFRLVGGAPSWFEQPVLEGERQKAIDTRRVRLGMLAERMLPVDDTLRARLEARIELQSTYVRNVFGLEGDGPSWFARMARRNH